MMDPLVWSLLLLLLGVLLLVLEIFIPSGGALSILSAITMVAAICVAYSGGIVQGTLVLTLTAVIVPLVLATAVKWWPQTPLGRLMLIQRSSDPSEVLPDTEISRGRQAVLGRFGRAKTKMLPSGAIVVDGRTLDALSEGMAIEPGQPIQVISIRTNRILVRPAEEHQLRAQEGAPSEDPDDIMSRPIESLGLDPMEDPLA